MRYDRVLAWPVEIVVNGRARNLHHRKLPRARRVLPSQVAPVSPRHQSCIAPRPLAAHAEAGVLAWYRALRCRDSQCAKTPLRLVTDPERTERVDACSAGCLQEHLGRVCCPAMIELHVVRHPTRTASMRLEIVCRCVLEFPLFSDRVNTGGNHVKL